MVIQATNDELSAQARLQAAKSAPNLSQTRPLEAYGQSATVVKLSDSVSVSQEAAELAQAVSRTARYPDIQSAGNSHMMALRQQVRSGSLVIDTMNLADAILREEGIHG